MYGKRLMTIVMCADSIQRLGMMILLGQHGQRQDNERGLQHIRFAAETADENAPQGSYVSVKLLGLDELSL